MSRTIQRIDSPTLRERVYHVTLESGLPVFFCPKPGFRKKYACYSTFYGSVDNEFVDGSGERARVPDGIAHFLEHTLFETDRGNVSDLFARHGAYCNASTSFTTTTYLFAASDRFYDNLELLLGFVETPAFRAEKVEKERGIIEQEIEGYEDSPDWVSYRTLLENIFERHPIRIDIAGTAETIREIDVPALERCYRAFYHPENMCLFVTGDLEKEELFAFIDAHSRPRDSARPVSRRHYPGESRNVAKRESRLEMTVALPKLLLGFKEVDVPAKGREYVHRELASEMALQILFGRGSDLFRELYDSQLALDDFSASYGAGTGIGYAVLGGDTPSPDKLREAIVARLEELRRKGLRDEDFERQKRKFIGGFIRGFNSLEYLASYYTYFRFHEFDLFDTIDLLHEVSKDELEARVVELLDPEYLTTVVVSPRPGSEPGPDPV
ncbi:MAG: pitrilysin family protein [Planctomycetota bacterium]|nr:pitrilysin family protein [Planctomycetota bacterium]